MIKKGYAVLLIGSFLSILLCPPAFAGEAQSRLPDTEELMVLLDDLSEQLMAARFQLWAGEHRNREEIEDLQFSIEQTTAVLNSQDTDSFLFPDNETAKNTCDFLLEVRTFWLAQTAVTVIPLTIDIGILASESEQTRQVGMLMFMFHSSKAIISISNALLASMQYNNCTQ
jgi:ribosomal protein L29